MAIDAPTNTLIEPKESYVCSFKKAIHSDNPGFLFDWFARKQTCNFATIRFSRLNNLNAQTILTSLDEPEIDFDLSISKPIYKSSFSVKARIISIEKYRPKQYID